jgi:triosephosphate isomerase (TIM)
VLSKFQNIEEIVSMERAGDMRKLIVGNWKMNGVTTDLENVEKIASLSKTYDNIDCGLCLPSTLIYRASLITHDFALGGQDCHMHGSGAHTGCVSAAMLADAGAQMVIVGHSERRTDQGESNADICAKAMAAREAGLSVIVCVGETQSERDLGLAVSTVLQQLSESVPSSVHADWISVAYEPVWAIGTGRVPSADDVKEMHGAIREHLCSRFGDTGSAIRILYGGSMNGDNAASLLSVPNVNGGLIGGASLTAEKFGPILAAAAG